MRPKDIYAVHVLAIAVALGSCTRNDPTQHRQSDINSSTYNAAESNHDSADSGAAAAADGAEGLVAMNSWDLDAAAAPSSENLSDIDTDPSDTSDFSGQVWVGISGVPQGCSLTNYKTIGDAALVLEQNGSTIVRKSPNLVVLSRRAPSGELKTVFANDEGTCDAIVAGSEFAGPVSKRQSGQ
jgi:hypothetical protein